VGLDKWGVQKDLEGEQQHMAVFTCSSSSRIYKKQQQKQQQCVVVYAPHVALQPKSWRLGLRR
jgi:hypothetical protein